MTRGQARTNEGGVLMSLNQQLMKPNRLIRARRKARVQLETKVRMKNQEDGVDEASLRK